MESGNAKPLCRAFVPELDSLLGIPISVLDDGFVRVVDYMGSDESIVQAARVSYGAGTKKVSEDRGLIRYLMRHEHTTPFEMCEIKLHVRVPMDTWRQWIRHRTASVNEYSTRYSIAIDAAQRTEPNEWRAQSELNRQGSLGAIDSCIGKSLTKSEAKLQALSRKIYEDRLELGVAREQARKDLPLSTYTEAYWKINLHNLLHFLWLRMDIHAQFEIRQYATVIGNEIVAKWCPIAWEAFVEYQLGGIHLTDNEIAIVTFLAQGKSDEAAELAKRAGLLSYSDGRLKLSRERSDFEAKIKRFGLEAPWESQ